MKQVLQSYRTGELWLAEVPTPACGAGGVVVRTRASLVSAGTEKMIIELAKKSLLGKARARPDLVKQVIAKVKTEGLSQTLQKVFAKLDTPIPLGYSAAGVVAEAGRDAGFSVGQRVACGGAGYATHAEANFVPRNLVAAIPDGVGDADACFATLGAIAMQGVRQADPRLGETVAVIGLGLLGLLSVQLLKAAGCVVVGSDLDPWKVELAKQLGADAAVAGGGFEEAVAAHSGGHGADAVVITAATPSNVPIEAAAEAARPKGRVVVVGLVGMDVPRDPFYKKELDLRLSMSYGPGRYDPQYEEGGVDYPYAYVRWTEQRNLASFLTLVAQGKVTPSKLVTHTFEIDNALHAYELLEGKGDPDKPHLGIVLRYPHGGEAATSLPARRVELPRQQAPASGGAAVGVSLIGAGNFAKGVLLPALAKAGGVTRRGLCTATGASAVETGKKHGFALAVTDPAEVFGDAETHAVVIATRHDTHARYAADALRAGKHVFVEKPLCVTEDELAELEAVVAELGGRCPCLMVGFNRRFSPHAVAIREVFASRQTPMVVTYRVAAGVIPPDVWLQDPAVGGGRIVGEVCHFVDFASSVIGAAPVAVQASCVREADARHTDEDSVVATLRYADGSLATIQYLAHAASDLPKERAEVSADGVTAVLDNFTRTDFHGTTRKPLKGSQAKGFAEEMAAFLRTAREGGDWPIPWPSLVATTRATFAIRQAVRSGETVALGGE